MFVKPAKEGLIVRDPDEKYRPIPASGKQVKKNAYWLRRLRDGDVVLSAAESKSKSSEPSKKKTKKKSEISEEKPLPSSKGDE